MIMTFNACIFLTAYHTYYIPHATYDIPHTAYYILHTTYLPHTYADMSLFVILLFLGVFLFLIRTNLCECVNRDRVYLNAGELDLGAGPV